MAATPTVEPLSGVETPQVEPLQPTEPQAPEPETEETELPEQILKIPAFQAVVAGTPPAVSMKLKGSEDREEIKLVADNRDALLGAGMGFYRSLSGEIGVMFNALKIHPDDLQAADKANKLTVVAPDFDSVNSTVAKSGLDHPALKANAPMPAAPMPASAESPPQSPSGKLSLVPPAPAAVSRKLAAQRIMNMQPGAPTSGPAPGAGRLLNQVLKPVM